MVGVDGGRQGCIWNFSGLNLPSKVPKIAIKAALVRGWESSIRDLGTLSGTLEPAVFCTASWRIRLAAYGARLERVLG